MRVNEWALVERCLEEGIEFGWNRAHKHTETPDPQHIQEEIQRAVMQSLCEFFHFESDPYE